MQIEISGIKIELQKKNIKNLHLVVAPQMARCAFLHRCTYPMRVSICLFEPNSVG